MARIPLYYTFGNHMHWVDMEWLWGYHVLPGSIRDMIHFCRETGARGNVNFEGIGYEKLAAEDPEALAELRQAVQDGMIEPVGCSYGQPYGLFHGGESNLRQRIYGARTVRRLLGVWPKTFWEEEFDFFPQLPQMLKGCGFEYASLFFQWTWHTPEIPKEEAPVVLWEGQDGSQLVCATRNKLNLHQWPEDMDATFAELWECANSFAPLNTDESRAPQAYQGESANKFAHSQIPLILQWLELMPSPDWMCRSELLLPKMRELLSDERFEIRMATLGEYLLQASGMGVPPMVSSDVPSESSEAELQIKQGTYLPHWTKDGGTYAVTFRLDDALPKHIQQQYAEERETLRKMHEQGRLTSTALAYEYLRLRTERVESALDAGHGSCLLKDPGHARVVHEALGHFDGDRYDLLASVVMPNHVHVLLKPSSGHELPKIIQSWKSYTAHEINRLSGRTGTLWQAEYYDHLVRDAKDLANQINYIRTNPEKAGLSSWPWRFERERPEEHDRDDHENHGRDAHATGLPVRRYTMDQVWHGMTLGKNGDNMRRESFERESELLSAESLAAILGLFGRPYAQWDVYPTWELEEQWRNLLMAQHHDNDECEGLCGHIGKDQYNTACRGALTVLEHQAYRAGQLFDTPGDVTWIYNPLGWARDWHVVHREKHLTVVNVPAYGWACAPLDAPDVDCGGWTVEGRVAKFRRGQVQVDFDLDAVVVTHFANSAFPDGLPLNGKPLWEWVGLDTDGDELRPTGRLKSWVGDHDEPRITGDRLLRMAVEFEDFPDDGFTIGLACEPHHEGLEVRIEGSIPRPKPGLNDAFGWRFSISEVLPGIVSDEPYAVTPKNPTGEFLKKYPEGDWMTSPQWFETVRRPFTGNTFVDLQDRDHAGLLIAHQGCRQWFAEDGSVRHILHAYDPWDEDRDEGHIANKYLLLPHRTLRSSDLWKIAQSAHRDCREDAMGLPNTGIPGTFSALSCDAPNVIPTAFYRETEDYSGKHVENYAGKGMGHPFVVRLVEFDGLETEATLTVAGTVAKAYKTNHLGQILHPLTPSCISETAFGREMEEGAPRSQVRMSLRPYEIATVYLDIVEGRKQTRDLDAKREIWATVHRVD